MTQEINNLKHLIELHENIEKNYESMIKAYQEKEAKLNEMLRKKTNALFMYHAIAGPDIDFKKTPEDLKDMYFDLCYDNGLSIPEGFHLDCTKTTNV